MTAAKSNFYENELYSVHCIVQGSDKRALSINTPFPYHPAGSSALFAELWFHAGNVSLECAEQQQQMVGAVAEVSNQELSSSHSKMHNLS